MDILLLTETEVQSLLDPDALLAALAEGFRALSSGLVDVPKRIGVSVPDTGVLLAMPAYQQGREVSVKLVSLFHENQGSAFRRTRPSSACSIKRRARPSR